jgi:ABC-type transport system involved in cytochrome bd biosynthesis fused ATPase/permease subunit
MSGGDLTAFLMYTTTVAVAVGSMAGIWGAWMRAAGATERLYEIIDQEPVIAEPEQPEALPAGGGAVRFDGVSFAYPGRDELPAVSNLSLEVPAGEMLAIVGGSGGGKSTLTSLLLRFVDAQSGAVTLDGVDVLSRSPISAAPSPSSIRSRSSSPGPSRTTSPSALRRPTVSRSRTPPAAPARTTSSPPSPRPTRPWWESAG